jgi:hypothetical protein
MSGIEADRWGSTPLMSMLAVIDGSAYAATRNGHIG